MKALSQQLPAIFMYMRPVLLKQQVIMVFAAPTEDGKLRPADIER